jgi:putative phosphoribosyl transferase
MRPTRTQLVPCCSISWVGRNAGRELAARLANLAEDRPVVLALPRGGVPVGFEVARALNTELDICIVRKLGVPGHEEFAMGAVASGGVVLLNDSIISALGIPQPVLQTIVARGLHEVARQDQAFRSDRPWPNVAGRIAILVDDGLATGSTMRAAVAAVRMANPARIVVAVPVASPGACDELRQEADEVVCAVTPQLFFAVGQWYDDFTQTSDDEVRGLLAAAAAPLGQADARHSPVSPAEEEST